jgi:hypothetical protein
VDEVQAALGRFYDDVMHALGEHMQRKSSTAQGSAAVVKHVAEAHGIAAVAIVPVPRLNRAELRERAGW